MIPRTTVDLGEEERKAMLKVLESGQYVKGKECKQLEEEFCEYQGVKFGAGVNSGTSALHLGLVALGVKPGDEVITVPNTFAATINPIIMMGAKPVFVDVNPQTFTIDVTKIPEAITPKTKAIIPVHLYGLMADMKSIADIAKENNLSVLEDACQSHGAEYFSKRAGAIGDMAAFSFFPTKNTTVGGDGGIVISNNEELIDKVVSLRDHGRKDGKHVMPGLNNRLSEVLAAVGRAHLGKLDQFNTHRIAIANEYKKNLSDLTEVDLPFAPDGYKHVYHLYTIKTEKRDQLREYLKENGVGSKVMYKERLNDLDYVKDVFGYQEMPINDKLSSRILSLPISGTLELDKINQVSVKINDFFKGA